MQLKAEIGDTSNDIYKLSDIIALSKRYMNMVSIEVF